MHHFENLTTSSDKVSNALVNFIYNFRKIYPSHFFNDHILTLTGFSMLSYFIGCSKQKRTFTCTTGNLNWFSSIHHLNKLFSSLLVCKNCEFHHFWYNLCTVLSICSKYEEFLRKSY